MALETPRVLAYDVLDHMPRHNSYVCGPCDGLYYLYHSDYCDRALWNPAISNIDLLLTCAKSLAKNSFAISLKPDLPSQFTYALYEVYGFGFDHVSGDYKVVVMKSYWKANHDPKHPVSVFVYSLSTDSWRYCGDLAKAYDLEINKCYIYVNECCYWFGSLDYSSEVIITFNMANDSFKEIDVPDYAQPSSKSLHETQKIFDIWTWSEGC
ncbi:hypothetical protein POM88_003722 [Heracleum sosnowskyi]|uniref:F-box associated beta-propeller type 1 domain-containing protein n=1 Tax=Heracleum sosnowskyi TaxID=360622 RepID=A0AAD8NCM0_9APIA|nr:hypothetical protein POM88_003722 [Heracleum sosnowskyi]